MLLDQHVKSYSALNNLEAPQYPTRVKTDHLNFGSDSPAGLQQDPTQTDIQKGDENSTSRPRPR